MGFNEDKRKLLWKNRYLIFLVLYLILIHSRMIFVIGDEVTSFSKSIDEYSFMGFLQYRYHSWSSRLLIDGVLILVAYRLQFIWLWKLLNIICWTVLFYCISYLNNRRNEALLFWMFVAYPMVELASAGWMATTINYLWPAAMLSVTAVSLVKIYNDRKIGAAEMVGVILAEVFATNFETLAGFYVCVIAAFCVMLIYEKKSPSFANRVLLAIEFVIALGNMVFALTCPGNAVRVVEETRQWLPEFAEMSFLDKIYMGVYTTLSGMCYSNIIFAEFLGIIILAIWLNKEIGVLPKILAFIPLGCLGIMWGTGALGIKLPMVWYIIYLAAVAGMLLFHNDHFYENFKMLVLLGCGMLTRLVMGFSPTVYVSQNRTFLFFNLVMVVCAMAVFSEIAETLKSQKILWRAFVAVNICVLVVYDIILLYFGWIFYVKIFSF